MKKDVNQSAYDLVKSVTDSLDPPLKPYEQILQLIEKVDPFDWETMDEIDARVHCYRTGKLFKSVKRPLTLNCLMIDLALPDDTHGERVYTLRDFCSQSRDTLKLYRPEGWIIETRATWSGNEILFYEGVACQLGSSWAKKLEGVRLPTEELAELYCLILVIAFERGEME